ncbi:hypothetical protein BYT27DRAFT_6935956 [Phlegmacium glaucopus]|nr:hypothetical protein BYT27DRAFT_6935956 [Phlegmacium glaucopus]
MVNATCSCKHLGDDHYFIRCGCKNDMPVDHPMRINDDAFHHVWCGHCLKFCYKKPACPARLPKTRVKRSIRRRLYKGSESVGMFTSVKMFFRKRMGPFSLSEAA